MVNIKLVKYTTVYCLKLQGFFLKQKDIALICFACKHPLSCKPYGPFSQTKRYNLDLLFCKHPLSCTSYGTLQSDDYAMNG